MLALIDAAPLALANDRPLGADGLRLAPAPGSAEPAGTPEPAWTSKRSWVETDWLTERVPSAERGPGAEPEPVRRRPNRAEPAMNAGSHARKAHPATRNEYRG